MNTHLPSWVFPETSLPFTPTMRKKQKTRMPNKLGKSGTQSLVLSKEVQPGMEFLPLHRRRSRLISVSLLLCLWFQSCRSVGATSSVYVVYMGEKRHEDPAMVVERHHQILSNVLGSKSAAKESIIYNYKHGFSGFAAKLTRSQAEILRDHPDVVHLVKGHFYKLHTTRSWDYLGLPLHSSDPTNLLSTSNMGHGSIIGIIDTGVWPESKSYSDKGMGPVPSHWKGTCQTGQHFKSTDCNNKLIGARWYIKGFLAQLGKKLNTSEYAKYLSPRDDVGHGSHTSSTAGGSPVAGVSQRGLAGGVARGGAPGARLAMYKACWKYGGGMCSDADVLKAMDDAIYDGVDVLSLSLGDSVPFFPDIHPRNVVGVGAFHAVAMGIPVVCAAGNDGPEGQSVINTAPWIITVAASTVDRAFPTLITLGDNQTFLGQAFYGGKEVGFSGLHFNEGTGLEIFTAGLCENLPLDDKTMAGKVTLCFSSDSTGSFLVGINGGVGVIVATTSPRRLHECLIVPCVFVDYQIGNRILSYIRYTRFPTVKISTSTTLVGKSVSIKIADFSSRGPNSMVPEILKPDIAAPGVNVLAASAPENVTADPTYTIESGTSVACPHVAGVVALLRTLHPSWSPAAIKSALVTTASTIDSSGEPIYALGSPEKVADPFDYGGGIVNPNKAANPGLVYDMGVPDYIQYLCFTGNNNSAITRLTKDSVNCHNKKMSILDLNLPSITIPRLHGTVTVTRTVTNVGSVNSVYHASVEAPVGVQVDVAPNVLIFSSKVTKTTFTVKFRSSHKVQRGYFFGSLSWSDGDHVVRSPVSVKAEIPPSFVDLS